MGMFDSLLVEINGKGVELQTKRFYKNLNCYQLGSVIKGSQPGISVEMSNFKKFWSKLAVFIVTSQ